MYYKTYNIVKSFLKMLSYNKKVLRRRSLSGQDYGFW